MLCFLISVLFITAGFGSCSAQRQNVCNVTKTVYYLELVTEKNFYGVFNKIVKKEPTIQSRTEASEDCCNGYKRKNKEIKDSDCVPICLEDCVNATCSAPYQCICNEGYVFLEQNQTACKPHCQGCEFGDCIAPFNCQCWKGYQRVNEICEYMTSSTATTLSIEFTSTSSEGPTTTEKLLSTTEDQEFTSTSEESSKSQTTTEYQELMSTSEEPLVNTTEDETEISTTTNSTLVVNMASVSNWTFYELCGLVTLVIVLIATFSFWIHLKKKRYSVLP